MGVEPSSMYKRMQRRVKGQILMPNIGYKSNKKAEHMLLVASGSFWSTVSRKCC